MTCENVYQSLMCCEFSELTTIAVPQLDITAAADGHAAHAQLDRRGGKDDGERGDCVGPPPAGHHELTGL